MQQRDSLFLSPSCRKGERYELCTTDCLFSAGIFPFGQGGGLARKLGIPQLVIGLTIVAMGTSLPEAAVSISAALRGNAEITIGNIVGSNILNILIILGVTALIATLKVADSTVRYEIPFMIVVTFVLLWLGYTGGQVTWLEGVILWVLFLLYLRYLYMMAKKGKEEEREVEQLSTAKIIGLILAGVVMIVAGSNFAVEGASNLAKALGISQRFIGLTIVALGTSLPELVTSVSAARKHNADIAIGNIVGSNIFNILFIVGTTALITPVTFASGFVVDTLIAAAVGILLFVCVARTKELRKKAGIVMLLAYILYFLYLL